MIDMLKDIVDSPRLVLCDSCQSEFLIPSWYAYDLLGGNCTLTQSNPETLSRIEDAV